MAQYQITDTSDGVKKVTSVRNRSDEREHDISIKTHTPIASGTITIKGRKPGSDIFEDFSGGTIDMSSPHTIQVVGVIAEFELTFSGVSGAGIVFLSDN